MTSWNDLTANQQNASTYSDMYKDAYGFRPHGIDTSDWTDHDFQEAFKELEIIIHNSLEIDRHNEMVAIDIFEQRVQNTIRVGAKDRATALRWIHDFEGSNNDNEYLCFLVGLPYGYFAVDTQAA
jgi:hypothetical protein